MKTKPIKNFIHGDGTASHLQGMPGKSHWKQRSGVALLIVLGMLVLLSVIVLAFVQSVTTDLGDSKAYEGQITTRMLADSAVNLVIGEIRQASTMPNSDGTPLAWISQPGLLRTYTTTGAPYAAYKLYSSGSMIVGGAFDPNAGSDLPSGATWMNQPNLYVDLNSPITSGTTSSGSTNYVFPIIDGNGIQKISLSGSTQYTYTTDGTIPTIEGFATNPAAVGMNYNQSTAVSSTNNPVPMPVQWLYMLKDGTLISGTAVGTSKDVTFNSALLSGTNPIVARIAFWTDDESSKLNINTASEGTFWDTPVCVTQPNVADAGGNDPVGNSVFNPNEIFEYDLALREPARNEYQRYPGHPATTCLSPVLGDSIFKGLHLNTGTSQTGYASNYGYHTLSGSNWANFAEFINQLTPRVSGSDAPSTSGSDYSSKAGTYRPGGPSIYSASTSSALGSGTLQGLPITPDQDRLYPTVDDYFYTGTIPSTPAVPTSGTARVFNGFLMTGTATVGTGTSTSGSNIPVLSTSLLEKAKFFLTANSKSPETNVFNMPRVCMWPITKTATTLNNPDTSQAAVTATMTTFDKVIAFCATVGGTSTGLANRIPFYFSRYDPYSQVNDFANSSNNQNLYTYLHTLMGQPYPGLSAGSGATFVGKYPSEDIGNANQILTEICDYIRCTNIADCSDDVYGTLPYGSKSYTQVNPNYEWIDQLWNSLTSQGQVVPLVMPSSAVSGTGGVSQGTQVTRGVGRFANIGELTLIMTKLDERINASQSETTTGTQIFVTGTSRYKGSAVTGTWNISQAAANTSSHTVLNSANVLIADPNKIIYAKPYPTGVSTPPTTDTLLLPGAGGLTSTASGSTSGNNLYDPRKQTKVQFTLMPYYFSVMAGFGAIGNNQRIHAKQFTLAIVTPSGSSTTVAPAPAGSTTVGGTMGTQGQDLYDSGRIDTINEMECKIGGPMGPKSLIDPSASTTIPTNAGAPIDSMFPVVEAIVNGTTSGSSSFSGTSPNTMTVSGTVILQTVAPAISVSWAARGITDQPTVIQTSTFVFPGPNTVPSGSACTVQIPQLNTQGATTYPFVGLQGGVPSGTCSTLSNNPATAESMIITATSAAQPTVKTGTSRMAPGSGPYGNYSSYMVWPQGTMQDIIRSLPLSGTMAGNVPIEGDFRMVAASQFIPPTWYQPMTKYTASGSTVPIATAGSAGTFSSGSLTPYFDKTQQYAYGWRTCIFYGGTWLNAQPPGNLISSGTTGTVTFPLYADNRHSPYVPLGINGVYNYLNSPGDWDNGPGWVTDGAYCNKPDEGWIRHYEAQQDFAASSIAPFIGHAFAAEDSAIGLTSLYAPNKMVSSPVMFGSLPTGVLAQHPWQTLLFRPDRYYFPGGSLGAGGISVRHPGAGVGGNGGQSASTSPGAGVMAYPPYSTLPDHALLDLFWMPVVDPYPISEPFATAGKVNLNYQIAPFTYITRKTALRGVLQSVKITAINPTETDDEPTTTGVYGNPGLPANPQLSQDYKTPGSYGNTDDPTGGIGDGGGLGVCVRRNIDIDDTLKQIDYLRFGLPGGTSVNKPFITASEICDVPLIPADLVNEGNVNPYNINSQIAGTTPSNYDSILAAFWYGNGSSGSVPFGHRLTGDNSLERPYSMIYPRLTTRSNTYTVHVRVQTLRKAQTTPANVFKDGQDQVAGEFRGSFIIERYLDPTTAGFYLNGNVSSPVSMTTTGAQLGPYKFRIISSKQFGQ